MPERRRSGQSDSVRGNALSLEAADDVVGHEAKEAHLSTWSTAASALAIAHTRNQQPHHNQRRVDAAAAAAAAAIRLVPVSSTALTINSANQLPPSPPSTPSHSPPLQLHHSESWNDGEHHWPTSSSSSNALPSFPIHGGSMPDTPDASPSTVSSGDGRRVTKQLAMSACDFVKTVLPNIVPISNEGKNDVHAGKRTAGHYIVEDAGLELVHHASVGAVLIYTGPATTTLPDMPRQRRRSSMRMARSSSPVLERVMPRRTLLTRIGRGDASDDNGLRASILNLLDHATERLHVDNVIFALDRTGMDDERFRATVHGLCYVGASIIGYGPLDVATHEERMQHEQHEHALQAEGGDAEEENIYAPRWVGRNLVLLSVDVV